MSEENYESYENVNYPDNSEELMVYTKAIMSVLQFSLHLHLN